MAEWTTTTVGALLHRDGGSIKTGPFGTTLKAHEYSTDGVPVISVGEVGHGRLRLRDDTPRAGAEIVERLPEYLLRTGDIVFGRKGAVDRSALVMPSQDGWFLGSDGIRLRLPPTVDPRFVAYQLQSTRLRTWITQHATGTTMPSLNQGVIERVPISLATLDVQRRIADILSSLDDRIELNRRMAETLEGLARSVYEELIHRVGAGEWPIGSIADIATNPRVQVDPTGIEPDTPYIGLEHMPRGRMVANEWGRAAEAESAKSAFQQGDILFGKLRPYFRKVGVAPVAGVCSTDILVLRPKLPADFGYLLGVATDPDFIDHATAGSTGTRMPRTSWGDLKRFSLPLPPQADRLALTAAIRPLIDRVAILAAECRSLSAIRDVLLPRLLSGDLEVSA